MGRHVQAEQLTPRTIECLMMRAVGLEFLPVEIEELGIPLRTLDFPQAERADVLLGLSAFAEDDARAARLAELYEELPDELKLFGPSLGDGSAAGVRDALATLMEE